MTGNKIPKVSVVSYVNSVPFIYGLEKMSIDKKIILQKDIPSDCAKKIINNNADIGLVPVAALSKISNYKIISDYCIGANGKVDSVFLFSNVELKKIKTIILDYQSNTSNNLAKILAAYFWKINVNWENANADYINKINENTAGIVIGDRTFNLKNRFKFVYDLSEEWKKFTSLPFVFALWISNTTLSNSFINDFNSYLQLGINNIDKLKNPSKNLTNKNFTDYITNKINYKLNPDKQKAIDLYLKYLSDL